MKGLIAAFTILVGLSTIGFALDSPIQVVGAPGITSSGFNMVQVILGIMIVLTGLVMMKRS